MLGIVEQCLALEASSREALEVWPLCQDLMYVIFISCQFYAGWLVCTTVGALRAECRAHRKERACAQVEELCSDAPDVKPCQRAAGLADRVVTARCTSSQAPTIAERECATKMRSNWLDLLEHYEILGATAGTWSEAPRVGSSSPSLATAPVPAPKQAQQRLQNKGLLLLDQYGALGAAPGAWSRQQAGPTLLMSTPTSKKEFRAGADHGS